MPSVIGIDVSSFAVDIVRLDETTNTAEWFRMNLAGDDSYQRLRSVPAAMPYPSFYDDVYIAGIEVPKSRYMMTAAALFPVYGAVVASVPWNLELWDVHPKTWRRSLGLPGNATKDEVRLAVLGLEPTFRHYVDKNHLPQDAYDAFAVAYHVRETNRRAIELANKEAT